MVPRRYVHVREPSGAVGTVTRARDHRRGRTLGQVVQNPDIACISPALGRADVPTRADACRRVPTARMPPVKKDKGKGKSSPNRKKEWEDTKKKEDQSSSRRRRNAPESAGSSKSSTRRRQLRRRQLQRRPPTRRHRSRRRQCPKAARRPHRLLRQMGCAAFSPLLALPAPAARSSLRCLRRQPRLRRPRYRRHRPRRSREVGAGLAARRRRTLLLLRRPSHLARLTARRLRARRSSWSRWCLTRCSCRMAGASASRSCRAGRSSTSGRARCPISGGRRGARRSTRRRWRR